VPQREDPEPLEALVEQAVDAVLQGAVEVDHHVAAENEVERVEGAVLHEVVRRPHDVLGERAIEQRSLVLREVVVGERRRPAGADVVLRVFLHLLEREHALACAREHDFVDVGRVDPRTVVQTLFLEQDRERVDLLARRASCDPDARERIRAEQRHDVVAKRDVERRVAEHRGDVDGKVEQQPLHHVGVMKDALDQRGDGLEPLGQHAAPHPSLERRRRVLAKVESVLAVDGLEKQLELERLEIQPPLGTPFLRCVYLYSHTRINDSS
jgi:hypothetical protein